MQSRGIQPEAWAPFAEGKKVCSSILFSRQLARSMAKAWAGCSALDLPTRHCFTGKISAKERMEENINILDFELSPEDICKLPPWIPQPARSSLTAIPHGGMADWPQT